MPQTISAAEDAIFLPTTYQLESSAPSTWLFATKGLVTNAMRPGLNTTRLLYSRLAQEVASQGFTVISLNHPFDTDIVQFLGGFVAYGGDVS